MSKQLDEAVLDKHSHFILIIQQLISTEESIKSLEIKKKYSAIIQKKRVSINIY